MHRPTRRVVLSLAGLLLLISPRVLADSRGFVSAELAALEREGASTTALRREEKIVVPKEQAEAFLNRLEQAVGPLKLRDVPPDGKIFVTRTRYLNTAKLLPDLLGYRAIPDGSISPKIRIRKYLTKDLETGKLRPSPLTDGVSLLELKTPHPTKPGITLKPRLFVNDRHLDLLLSGKHFRNEGERTQVVQALKADTRNDASTVDRMVTLIGELHAASADKKLKAWVQTDYQRSAYQLALPGGGDLQITVDKKVRYRDPKDGDKVAKLGSGVRALEIKIPDAYASLSEPELRRRGLTAIAEVRALQRSVLAPSRVAKFGVDRGKCSAFGRVGGKAVEKLKARAHWQ
jgi:hypothetical protein